MSTLRRVVVIVLLGFVVAVAAFFGYINPEPIDIDVGVARLEGVPASVAFVTVFALGWVFGLACASFGMLRLAADRRRLRRELRLTEAEVRNLRSFPLHDAD
ncbi:MAG TPA: lipopolysaccharide assembly protein LapA domain-containing protein [Gammaproteobacteria bacterium]